MKITLWNIISVNGFVARSNNKEDYISDKSWKQNRVNLQSN